jgi:Holliday junction DNA helicase RuvA
MMISFIKGSLESISEDTLIIENNGIGYEVKVPISIVPRMPSIGGEVKIYTYHYVREDAMSLFGFLTRDDLDVFKKLLTVNGIGPKGALGILSTVTSDELIFAVMTGDDKTIAKAPGVGKKTAQRLIIDLKDKLKLKDYSDIVEQEVEGSISLSASTDIKTEAINALIALGYSQNEAIKVVRGLEGYQTVEDLLKQALKELAII